MTRGRPIIECWCCGQMRPRFPRELCEACYRRWCRKGFTGPGPGPSLRLAMAERASDYATVITTLSASKAAGRIGVTPRTITRWRRALERAT